jgi:hypothetical protein
VTYVRREKTAIGKNLDVALKNLTGKVAKVGWFENSRYPEPPHIPVAYVATIHEFGYLPKNIPPRPFMRPTVIEKRNEWKDIAKQGAFAILKGEDNVHKVMERIGLKAAADVRKTISRIQLPELKPRTIAARLAKRADKNTLGLLEKPLIDTGLMYGTLTNTVETE